MVKLWFVWDWIQNLVAMLENDWWDREQLCKVSVRAWMCVVDKQYFLFVSLSLRREQRSLCCLTNP